MSQNPDIFKDASHGYYFLDHKYHKPDDGTFIGKTQSTIVGKGKDGKLSLTIRSEKAETGVMWAMLSIQEKNGSAHWIRVPAHLMRNAIEEMVSS